MVQHSRTPPSLVASFVTGSNAASTTGYSAASQAPISLREETGYSDTNVVGSVLALTKQGAEGSSAAAPSAEAPPLARGMADFSVPEAYCQKCYDENAHAGKALNRRYVLDAKVCDGCKTMISSGAYAWMTR